MEERLTNEIKSKIEALLKDKKQCEEELKKFEGVLGNSSEKRELENDLNSIQKELKEANKEMKNVETLFKSKEKYEKVINKQDKLLAEKSNYEKILKELSGKYNVKDGKMQKTQEQVECENDLSKINSELKKLEGIKKELSKIDKNISTLMNKYKVKEKIEREETEKLEDEESIEDILMEAYEKGAKETMERHNDILEAIEIQNDVEKEFAKQPPAVVPPRDSEKQPPAVIPPKAPEKQKPQFIFDRKAHLYILIDEEGKAKGVNVFKKNEAGKYENTLNDEFVRTAKKSLEARGLTRKQIKSVDMNLLKAMMNLGRKDLYDNYIEGIKNGTDLKFDLIYLMGKGKDDDISKKDIKSILNVAKRQEKLGMAIVKEDKKEKRRFRLRDIPKRVKAALAVLGLGTGLLLAANSQETKIPENPKEITTEDTHDALENKKQEQKETNKNNQRKSDEDRTNIDNKEDTEKDTVKNFKDSYKADQKEEEKDTNSKPENEDKSKTAQTTQNTNVQPTSQTQSSNDSVKNEIEGKIKLEDKMEFIGGEEYTFQKDSGELQPSKEREESKEDMSIDREQHIFEDIIMNEPDPKYNEDLQESLMEEYEQGAKEAMERHQEVEEAIEIQRDIEEEEER